MEIVRDFDNISSKFNILVVEICVSSRYGRRSNGRAV
jgi:hypothetical protein